MTIRTHYLAAAAAMGALAIPAAAQTAYPYGNQQPAYPQYQQPYTPQQAYPTYQQPSYGQPAYGYNQGYAQNPVSAIIDGLLGNRYNVTDRQAVSQCASAAMAQASSQYGGYGNGYGHDAYRSGYGGGLRVTSITDVQRRSNGLRVKGLMSSGGGYHGQSGYQNRGYAGGELTFRCNVDYRGAVTNIRIGRNDYRR